jgi:hypothetical protein
MADHTPLPRRCPAYRLHSAIAVLRTSVEVPCPKLADQPTAVIDDLPLESHPPAQGLTGSPPGADPRGPVLPPLEPLRANAGTDVRDRDVGAAGQHHIDRDRGLTDDERSSLHDIALRLAGGCGFSRCRRGDHRGKKEDEETAYTELRLHVIGLLPRRRLQRVPRAVGDVAVRVGECPPGRGIRLAPTPRDLSLDQHGAACQ